MVRNHTKKLIRVMSVDLMRAPGFKDAILVVVIQVEWLIRPQDHIGWLAVIESDQRAVIPILVALYLRQAGYRVGLSHRLKPGAAVHEKVPRDANLLGVNAALRRGSRQLLGVIAENCNNIKIRCNYIHKCNYLTFVGNCLVCNYMIIGGNWG